MLLMWNCFAKENKKNEDADSPGKIGMKNGFVGHRFKQAKNHAVIDLLDATPSLSPSQRVRD